jgi:hypothetical protein
MPDIALASELIMTTASSAAARWIAGNRDPRQFPEPDRIDFERPRPRAPRVRRGPARLHRRRHGAHRGERGAERAGLRVARRRARAGLCVALQPVDPRPGPPAGPARSRCLRRRRISPRTSRAASPTAWARARRAAALGAHDDAWACAKAAFDPGDIIAPGRYVAGPAPARREKFESGSGPALRV